MKHGWEYKKLGDCFPFIKNGANIKQIKGADGLPITRIETLSGGVFNRDRMGYAGIYNLDKYSDYVLEDGDLLLSHINSKTYIGRTVEYRAKNDETIIHGMNLLRLKSNSDVISSSFFAYYTLSNDFKTNVAKVRKDAVNQSSIAISDIRKFSIPVPPIQSQQYVVDELDKINELIRLKKEQLKDYDNLAQSIFYEMFGDPVVNEKGWNVKKLGDVCEVSSFKRVLVEDVLEKGPVPFIRGTELSAICKENKREYKMYITMEHYERVKNISGVPNVGDLLIPSINAEGLVWVVDTPEPMYYKDGRVLWVHVDQNSISPIALQRILNNLIKDNYSKITNGAVFAELNLSILRSFPIILPPLSIQNAFANKINLIEKQKAEIQSTIADLETLLASRMQYWFD